HPRNAESRFHSDRNCFLLSLQQRHEKAQLLHGTDEDLRLPIPLLAVTSREGGLHNLRYSEHLGCLPRLLQASAGQIARARDTEYLCLRLSADRQWDRPGPAI